MSFILNDSAISDFFSVNSEDEQEQQEQFDSLQLKVKEAIQSSDYSRILEIF